MLALFASDVHLSPARPGRVRAFLDFLGGPARRAAALYLLGDVFDEWLGDDDAREPHPALEAGLAALTAAGVTVRVLHGNHDFLLGEDFARRTGCALLPDPAVVEVGATRVLLSHGDGLCTDDPDYQRYRAWTRDPDNQRQFLALPLAEREARAAALRHRSRALSRLKPEEIMDVAPTAVRATMRRHEVAVLVHGHTHRPAVHAVDLGPGRARRVVLGDWYEGDSVLAWDRSGPRLVEAAAL